MTAVEITGNELGRYSGIDDLRKKARSYAFKHIAGLYTVKSNGDTITVSKSGIKHSTTTHNANKIKAIVAIGSLVENAQLVTVEPDKKGRAGIKAVRKYAAVLCVNNTKHPVLIVVRETKQGKLFYDHYIEKKPVGSEGSDEQLTYRPTTSFTKNIRKKQGDVNGILSILVVIGAALASVFLEDQAA